MDSKRTSKARTLIPLYFSHFRLRTNTIFINATAPLYGRTPPWLLVLYYDAIRKQVVNISAVAQVIHVDTNGQPFMKLHDDSQCIHFCVSNG